MATHRGPPGIRRVRLTKSLFSRLVRPANILTAGWIVFVLLVGNLALHARIHEPLFYDSNGYFRAARDIGLHGILSHFEFLWIRTYAYPLLLSWGDRVAILLGLPLRLVVTELQLFLYISAGLLLRRAMAVYPHGAAAVDIGMYLNLWAVFLTTDVLTDSPSLSLSLIVVSCWLWAWQNFKKPSYWIFLCGGSLLVGFCVMVRPANIFLLAAWFAGHLLLILRDNEITLRMRMRLALLAATAMLALPIVSMLPQLYDNVAYYGRWTPLVTSNLRRAQAILGVKYIKYATAIPPVPITSVTYANPFFAGTRLPDRFPSTWYIEHPLRGAATIGLHVFDMVDQDFPFVYVRDVLPWYRLPEAVALHLLAGLGLIGLFFWATMQPYGKPSEIREAITRRIAYFLLVGAYLAVYCTSDPESRFGVPLLWAIFPFSGLAVRRLKATRGKWFGSALLIVVAYAAIAVRLSAWVTAQSPAIEKIRHFGNDPAQFPAPRQLGTLSVTPSSGSGRDQLFDVVLSRTTGAPMPVLIGLLINDHMDGSGACYVLHYVSVNTTSLVADSGSGAKPLGKAGSVGNQQCELLEGRTKSSTPSEVEVEFHLRFRPSFRGTKQLYLIAEDAKGGGASLQRVGEWTVP